MTQAYILTVTKFNNIIKSVFNSEELLHNIKIVGEVFGISYSKTAIYFSVKDEESSLPCVCFFTEIMKDVKEGDMVEITGSPNYYTKSGRFNFVVNAISPFGVGILYQKFVELKEKLEKEGLFDSAHKKTIPKSIKRIGVVTSKDGAVIQDIKNVTWRRNPGVDIVLYDSKVQGNGAENEIAKGINFFSGYDGVDVVVVARGGGSLEDLSVFNTEIVARAAYNCQKPIVSAVGHETDFTIIDFVSDLRAPTPSAAAELLTFDTKLSLETLEKEKMKLARAINLFLAEQTFKFSSLKGNLSLFGERYLAFLQSRLVVNAKKLSQMLENFSSKQDYRLKLMLATLKKLNPLDILSLGYAKIEQNGKPIAKKSQLKLSDSFDIHFADGKVTIKGE